jgi:hypothetical protein
MENVSNYKVSKYRQEIVKLVMELKRLCLKAGYGDIIFRGVPIEVYRKCGKPNCRCTQGGESRHGPYQAIQIWEDGRQRQISLKQTESKYFEMAKLYQYQQQNYRKITKVQQALLKRVEQMLEERCICSKK